MARCWAVNYQPATGDRVFLPANNTETTEGNAAMHADIDTALAAGATQIGMLLDLLSECAE